MGDGVTLFAVFMVLFKPKSDFGLRWKGEMESYSLASLIMPPSPPFQVPARTRLMSSTAWPVTTIAPATPSTTAASPASADNTISGTLKPEKIEAI